MNSTMMRPGQVAQAQLFLYTPRVYGDQVLRPFVYGFTENTIDKLMGAEDSLVKAYARPDIATCAEVANAIKPDSVGSKISMDVYSSFWTFMLVIRQPNNYAGVAMSASGARTTVMTGHCIGEPVAPNTLYMTTPIINNNCALQVHTHQILNTDQAIVNAFGMRNPTRVVCNDDVIDPSMNMAAPNTDLYRMTPVDVLSNYDTTGTADQVISTPGLCMVKNLDRNAVQSSLKAPGVHFRQILEGLDSQIEFGKASQFSPVGVGISGVLSDCEDNEQFKEGVRNQLSQQNFGSTIDTDGLSATGIFTIQDIQNIYPGLVIQPQRVSDHSMMNGVYMDIVPQTITNPKVLYSSFCASAIGSIAADCGLSSISFAYTSHDAAKSTCLDKSTFQVVADNAYLSCPPSDPQMLQLTLKGAVEMFKHMFQRNVAPFITGVVGNFELYASYSNNAETQVNLTLQDWDRNTNLGENLWLEQPNRLGSLSSTSLGSEAVFMGNGHSLNQFVNFAQARSQNAMMGIGSAPDMSGAAVSMPDLSGFGGF